MNIFIAELLAMRKQSLCFLLFLLCCTVIFSQKVTITRLAYDSLARQPVSYATVTLLQKKDSTLVSFTMTDQHGRFELSGISSGEYRLLLTHLNYPKFYREPEQQQWR
ncbi:MAG: hypothetical protein C4308_07050 [Chitinophagaceae bacterium]